MPVAAVLWARVSPAIDEQLSADLDKPVRLRADQWASGDRLWLMAAAGDQRYMPAFLEQLNRTEFKGVPVKLRMRGADGKASLALLDQIVVTRHGSIGP